MTESITKTVAVDLAHAYADAMRLSASGSAFGLPHDARTIVTRYLDISQKAGVRMHNDAWEEYIWKVVLRCEEKRRKAVDAMLGREIA